MEHPAYRDNLEQILAFTGGRNLLNIKDVKAFTGIRDPLTVRKRYPMDASGHISAATLARQLCGGVRK
ncbi:MAG: hypothetical protein MRZ31_06460 [Dysosmobacter sp.]|uniref:hypothetical protein n=1 Tax=Dysosmobacter sp. TaxID=2591382 RepID=UPI0026726CB1|nr:hypothetical protein [Dysosmobacter sp.]MCI6016317.1 hypothetical protein [Dysosmobacter sp.]